MKTTLIQKPSETTVTILVAVLLTILFFLDGSTWVSVATGFAATVLVSLVLKIIIVDGKYGFKDFFIGENKSYSLSRVQFFFWVILIISCQVSIITVLIRCSALSYYDFILGENILWILAASFGTYLSVQGITNVKKREDKLEIKTKRDLADLLKDGDQLDFTKFQMALWTLIAIGIYFYNSVEYIGKIQDQLTAIEHLENNIKTTKPLADEFVVIQNKLDSKRRAIERLPKRDVYQKFDSVRKDVIDYNKALTGFLITVKKSVLVPVETLDSAMHLLSETSRSVVAIRDSSHYVDSLVRYANQELAVLRFLNDKSKKSLHGLGFELENERDKLKGYFKEQGENETSTVPDISVTFLVLMGLIQGTYVGKKLLPAQDAPAATSPETAQTQSGGSEVFVPETPEGREKLDALKLEEAYVWAKRQFWPRDYVTGIDIGTKRIRGQLNSIQAIRIHIKLKTKDVSQIPASELIPKYIFGIPTDVIQSNFIASEGGDGTPATRPPKVIQPGVSIGDSDRTGTLGLLVFHSESKKLCALSNYHVLTDGPVIQPGKSNGGNPTTDVIGKIVEQINEEGCDGALAEITSNDQVSFTIKGTNVELKAHRFARPLETLKKSGNGTFITEAIVEAENGEYKIPGSANRIHGFLLRKIRPNLPISGPRDSGSVWFNEDTNEAIGLHVGKSEEDGFAVACHLPKVLEKLKAQLTP